MRSTLLGIVVVVGAIALTTHAAPPDRTDPPAFCEAADCGSLPPAPGEPGGTGAGGGTRCTGIGGCNACVRDPFAPITSTIRECKFVEDVDASCKCWQNPDGTCGKSGTCTYYRYGGDPTTP